MKKIIINIITISIMFGMTLLYAIAGNTEYKKLDSFNIIPSDRLELSLDNNIQKNITVVKEDDILYIDSRFFTTFLGIELQDITNQTVTVKEDKGKEIMCLPLFKSLDSLKIRYTYSSLYGKEIIRIRTDGAFKIYKASNYMPETVISYGNNPSVPAGSYAGTDTYYGNSSYSYSGTGYYYSSACSTGGYYGVPGYGYYYPEGYTPGSCQNITCPNQQLNVTPVKSTSPGPLPNIVSPIANIVKPL
ncbi:MAG: hypothetical protein ABRQ38_19095 [Candidatus Eremiobacterota bacterium]